MTEKEILDKIVIKRCQICRKKIKYWVSEGHLLYGDLDLKYKYYDNYGNFINEEVYDLRGSHLPSIVWHDCYKKTRQKNKDGTMIISKFYCHICRKIEKLKE